MCRVLHRLDSLLKTMAAEAMEVTQVVCSAQNVIRKKFVSDMKRSMSDALQVKKDWQHVIVQLTHERSVCFVCMLFSCHCFHITAVSSSMSQPVCVFELTELCGMMRRHIPVHGNLMQQKVLAGYDVVYSDVSCV